MLRIATIIISIVTLLLLFSVMVCGLWIGSVDADAGSVSFHRTLGVASVLSGTVTCVLALVSSRKKRTRP